MLFPTHGVFGVFLSLSVLALFGIKTSMHWSILVFAILGSITPDIDLPRSLIGRIFYPLSKYLERKYGHRTVTHSLIGWLVATVILGSFLLILSLIPKTQIPNQLIIRWFGAFVIGYLSHLILDMFNPKGSQLFWPDKGRDVIPRNPKYRIEVGSKSELIIFLFLFGMMFLGFPLSKYGIKTSLRWLLATPSATMAEFQDQKTKLFIEFKGRFNDTHEPLKTTAEILDAQNKRLFVLLAGKIYTLSDELSADIIASKVRFKQTDTPIQIDTKAFKNEKREALLTKIPNNALISGTVHLPKGLTIYTPYTTQDKSQKSSIQTITQKKDTLILTYANKSELEALALNESYEIQLKKDKIELRKLKSQIQKINKKIEHIQTADGLTEYGRQLLLTDKDREERKIKIADQTQKLEETNLRIKELNLTLKERRFVFSGEVTIRH